ncbi:malectin domain-containing carbohydrate-binding protein [Cyclobacterium jeungdonense]|uniref:Malectin domain-containing carbohydrate-binding protein n=1 Tax=Cyclobacterium jeungdonense TaxID=708087 RepID=A0ABT8C3F0_9BACT|nr:malectin domain-containing carbohydrate-binding protein [Cyclobacterium jeungdonense]MDN3686841.1 malectin domain-containing carbohydrate-binding protein [Cyclobacterium jeungdonense]
MTTVLYKVILCCTLLLSGLSVNAANYYFSDETGDDSRSFSQAQNAATPWKSISKLNAIISGLNPGDKVFFRRGETFYGTIRMNVSGNSGAPVTFGAYGSGPDPIITSMVRLSNWQSVGNGVYEASDSRLPYNRVNMLAIDDNPQEMGRYPNSNTSNKGYLTYESHSGNRSISDYQLSSSPNWSGGEVVIRKVYWITDRHRITSHSGNTLNYASNPDTSYEPRAGYGYFIQNHPSTLDRYGEWYYNPSTRKMRVYFGSNPGSARVEAATNDFIVENIGSAKYITFENLHFKGANRNAFQFESGNDIKITNCKINLSGEDGLYFAGISNLVVENSEVNYSNNVGMNIKISDGTIIRGNSIQNTYVFPGHGRSGDNVGLAIFSDGNDNLIEYNEIKKTGYIGIRFGGHDSQVKSNYIDGFCITKNDGGGIYTYQDKYDNYKNRKISNNIIINGVGVKEGTTINNLVDKPQAEGIYLDDNVTDVEVSGNTVAHITSKGIYLHNTNNIRVINNTIYDSDNLIFLRNDLMGNPLENTTIENNKLLAKDAFQNFVYVYSLFDDVADLARFNYNEYSAPFSDNFRFKVRYNANSSNEANKFFDLKGWQRMYNKDWSSKTGTQFSDLYKISNTIGSNRYSNGTFDQNVNYISCSDCSKSWDSGKLDGGSLKISTNGISQTSISVGSIKKGKYYRLKFSAVANKTIPISFYLRQGGSPWYTLSSDHTVGIDWQKSENEILIQSLTDMESTRLVMEIGTGESGELWLDNLEFQEVEASVIRPEDKVLFEKNPSRLEKTFSTSGGFVGLLNEWLSSTQKIAPYSSLLLLKSGSGVIEQELPKPSVSLTKPEPDQSSDEGHTVMIEATASVQGGEISRVDFYNGSEKLGSANTAPFAFAWEKAPSGTHNLSAVAVADNGQEASSPTISFSVTPTSTSTEPETFSTYFINAGGKVDTDWNSMRFSGENTSNIFYNSSKVFEEPTASSYTLFQTERYSESLSYAIPVPNGTYYVYTLHNELWFGKQGPSGQERQRVFDISIENSKVKEDFDLYKENGNKPMALTFKGVNVIDGVLNLDFASSLDNATVSGIIISQTPISIPDDLKGGTPPATETSGYSDYLMINTGSRDDVTFNGKQFVSDYKTNYFTSYSANFNYTVGGELLFQTERYARNMNIRIPVENGTYQVKTYHNELWFGSFGPTAGVGKRVFDIYIEGNLKKDNFDIYAEKSNSPTILTFSNIEVTDGWLDLNLSASNDNATISALYIGKATGNTDPESDKSLQEPIFLNAGTYDETTYSGQRFIGDRNTDYANTSNVNFNLSVSGSEMFLTERYARNLDYSIPVKNGTYTVITYHNELWFGSYGPPASSGNRVFDISIEGNRVKSNFDIYKESGNNPTTLTFRSVKVGDGILDISMTASTNNATVAGIAVIPEGGSFSSNLRLATAESVQNQTDMETESAQGPVTKVYPNPASHQATVSIGEDVSVREIYIQSTSGSLVKSIDPESASDGFGTYALPLEGLQSGIYIVTVSDGGNWIKKLKLIVE